MATTAAHQPINDQFYESMASDFYADHDQFTIDNRSLSDSPNSNDALTPISKDPELNSPSSLESFGSSESAGSDFHLTPNMHQLEKDFNTSLALELFCDELTQQVLERVAVDLEEARSGTSSKCSGGNCDDDAMEEVKITTGLGESVDSYLYGPSVDDNTAAEESPSAVSGNIITYCLDQAELAISSAMLECSPAIPSNFSPSSSISMDYYSYEGSVSTMIYQEFPAPGESHSGQSSFQESTQSSREQESPSEENPTSRNDSAVNQLLLLESQQELPTTEGNSIDVSARESTPCNPEQEFPADEDHRSQQECQSQLSSNQGSALHHEFQPDSHQESPTPDFTPTPADDLATHSMVYLRPSSSPSTVIVKIDTAVLDYQSEDDSGIMCFSGHNSPNPDQDSKSWGEVDYHSDLGHVELYYAIGDGGDVKYISELNCYCLTKYCEIEI